jgi:hypothetical protein
MADPWVPSYFGSWQQLVDEALAGLFFPTPNHWLVTMSRPAMGTPDTAANRSPSPVRWLVDALISAANARELARYATGEAREQLESRADAAIAQILDNYCGTPVDGTRRYQKPTAKRCWRTRRVALFG